MIGGLVGVVEQRHDAEVVGVQDGVVLVRMALGAVHGQAHPGGAGGPDAVDHGVEAVFVRIDAALLVEHGVAVEAGGHEVFGRGAGQEVARELLDAELVVGEVGVQRLDHPVAVRPDRARAVLLETVGVGVTREVEPAPRPALAVTRGSEQAIHELFVGVRGSVADERVGFFGRGRDAGEVQGDASDERVAVGFRRGLQAELVEARAHEGVDGVEVFPRERNLLGRRKGPVRLVDAALGDPGAQDGFVLGRHGLLALGRRHDVLVVGREDALDDLALVGLARDDRDLARLAFAMRGRREVEAQLRFPGMLVHAMAREAVLGQDRTDLAVEIHGRGFDAGRSDQYGEDSEKGHDERGLHGDNGRVRRFRG